MQETNEQKIGRYIKKVHEYKGYILVTLKAMAPLTRNEIYLESPEFGPEDLDFCNALLNDMVASGEIETEDDQTDPEAGWYAKGDL